MRVYRLGGYIYVNMSKIFFKIKFIKFNNDNFSYLLGDI